EEGKKKTRKGKDVKIPPVIPFIIHQGKRRFSAPRNLVDLSMDSLDASPYLLNLSPILFDLASIKEDHLPNDENYPALNLGLKIMQGIFKKDIAYTTKEVLSKLEPYKDQQFGRDLIRTILLYVAKNGQYIKKEEIHEIGNTIHFNKEDKMAFISVADKIYLEGKAEGIAEGIAEGEARGEAKSIISILKKRFSEVSSDLCEAIREKQDSIVLESLLVVALDCSSIEEFSKVLEK
ncbi:MAG: Rpn family recombination-promoting nuclease/putative transposase, partial [Planctomycetia bacterium]|nr:Rpn family recombination-promoting nuclease/putative transposase [Planctomycetia bacterium]